MLFFYSNVQSFVSKMFLPAKHLVVLLACVAADSFAFSGGAEIEQANEKRASEGARLG